MVLPARDLDLLPVFETLSTAEYDSCVLPCWWGFRPGETTLSEIVSFLEVNDFQRQWEESIYSSISLEQYTRSEQFVLYFHENSFFGSFTISFSFDENDLLRAARVAFNDPDQWLSPGADISSLAMLLEQVEETPEIYIAENPSTFRISGYRLVVIFREQGVRVNYVFDLSGDNPINGPLETLRLCLDLDRTNGIEMTLSASPITDPLPDFYKTPEAASGIGISTEEFVEFFRENPDDCLDIAEYQRESE
jgi:hypothetical protein